MTLVLTIRIQDADRPERMREHVVEARDLWMAIHELREVAGPNFVRELMFLSWEALTKASADGPPDQAVTA